MSSISANQIAVSELYIACLGREPEQGGYSYWVNKLNAGETQLQAAAEMAYAPEFFDTYGGLTVAAAIARIYTNVFERTGDANGLTYWSGRAQALITAGTPVVVAYAQTASNMIVAGYTNGSTDTPLIQARVASATAAGTAEPSVTHTLTTSQFDYSGTQANDIYNAPLETLGGAAVMTLQAFTSIDGAGGTNTVNAVMNGSVTPLELLNIQIVNATTSANATLGLINATSATTVSNVASSGGLTFSGLAATAVNLVATSPSAGADTVFAYASTTGTQSVNLTVDNLATLAVGPDTSDVTIAGIETIAVTAANHASTFTLIADAATTVNIAGSQNLTMAGAVVATLINGSSFTGNLTTALTVAGTLNGGTGNDVLTGGAGVKATISGNAGNDSIVTGTSAVTAHADSLSGGAGNDTFTFANGFVADNATATLNDSVDGGTGVNTLVVTAANAEAVTTASTTIDNIQTLSLSSAGTNTATLQVALIDSSIATVNLGSGSGATYTVNMNAGTSTLTLGDATASTLLTVNDTGTALTDSLTISNSATTGAVDMFAGAVTSAGFETLTINTGSVATAQQEISTLTVNTDATATGSTVNFSGANTVDISTILTTSSTGLTTVNGSGLTATTGTVLDINAMAAGTAGTFSITGSEGNDAIATGNFASTVLGGGGNDAITGGTGTADSIDGGAGIDTLDGGTGNDTIKGGTGADVITASTGSVSIDGGAGNDTITLGATLTSGDTVDGGADIDTLVLTAAVVSPSVGARVSNVEILNTTAAAQDMSMFTGNAFTTVVQAASGGDALALTNAASTLTGLTILDGSINLVDSVVRDVDTSSNALTVTAGIAIAAGSALTASNEETVTVAAATFAADLDLATMTDLTTLNVTGSGSGAVVIDAQLATLLATVNTAGVTGTGTVFVDASDSTVALTFTGAASTGNQSITSGSGADVITAGSGITVVIAGSGNDTVTGSTLADTITGGAGADSVTGGTGADTFLVGATLTDWAVGDYVAGGTGTDILSFGAAGIITYVDRTVSLVETLTLTTGDANVITVTQGTGLVTVNNLVGTTSADANTLTLNAYTSVFGAQAASAAAVTAAGQWYADTSGAANDVVTYWDQVTGAAVAITLVGVDTGASSAYSVVGGNLVATITVD